MATAAGATAAAGEDRPLSGHELRRLFSTGAVVRALPRRPDDGPFSRAYYYSNGKYQNCGHGPVTDGVYSVRGSEVCISARGWHSCRRFSKRPDGTFVMSTAPYPSVPNARPAIVSITPGADTRNCNSAEEN